MNDWDRTLSEHKDLMRRMQRAELTLAASIGAIGGIFLFLLLT